MRNEPELIHQSSLLFCIVTTCGFPLFTWFIPQGSTVLLYRTEDMWTAVPVLRMGP